MQARIVLVAVIVFISLFSSCSKTSTETLDETVSMEAQAGALGSFAGVGAEKVTGSAQVFRTNNQNMLKLENFSASNGPDLKVYLSKAATPTEFISLGDLKSTNGNQVYEVKGNPDFKLYKFVLIHCERFNHLFGVAELK